MRRRLTAFIAMSVTALIGIGTAFVINSHKVNPGLELTDGVSYVYHVYDEDTGVAVDLDEAAKEMKRRLDMSEVTYYEIETEGTDQIRVNIAGDTTTLTTVKSLLSYNADFTIATTDDEVSYTYDEIFDTEEEAYLKFVNQYPVCVFPIADETKVTLLCEHAQTLATDDEDGNSDDSLTKLILWADKEEGDDYANAMDEDYEGYEKIRDKVFLTFDSTIEDLWYDSDHEEIAKTVEYTDSDGNAVEEPSAAQVQSACVQAQTVVNYFNAGKLDYDVDFLYQTDIDATISNIVNLGDRNVSLNWTNGIVISMFVCIVMAALLMAGKYKWGSVVSGLTTCGSVVLTLGIYNVLGVEFGIGALVGLVATGLLGLFTNIFIFEKVKDELYKGRTFKKAYSEGQKRSNFVVVDASLVMFLISFLCFFVGGKIVQEFGVMMTIGAIANLLIAWLGNKLLLWPLCNEFDFQDKKNLIGVDTTKVPDTLKEEKQTYFGQYADKDFGKHHKVFASVGTIVAAAGVIFAAVAGSLWNKAFNYGSTYDTSYRVQMKVEQHSALASASKLEKVLTDNGFELLGETTYDEEADEDDEDIIYCYYEVNVNLPSESDYVSMYTAIESGEEIIYSVTTDVEATMDTLSDNLYDLYKADDSEIEVKVLNAATYQHNVTLWLAAISLGSGIILAGLYLMIRYGFAKGLAGMTTSAVSTLATMALFTLCRIPFSDIVILSWFLVAGLSYLASLFIFARDKELVLDNKEIEKEELNRRSVNESATPIILLATIAFFFGAFFMAWGPYAFETTFASLGLGAIILTVLVLTILAPFYSAIRKNNGATTKVRRHKRKHVEQTKSAEPEEAIFIGIND